jgi:hypothetical protein
MIFPQINLNGSDGKILEAQYKACIDLGNTVIQEYEDLADNNVIWVAFRKFSDSVYNLDVHGRDYQILNNYSEARREHLNRLGSLHSIASVLMTSELSDNEIETIKKINDELKEIYNNIIKQNIERGK